MPDMECKCPNLIHLHAFTHRELLYTDYTSIRRTEYLKFHAEKKS